MSSLQGLTLGKTVYEKLCILIGSVRTEISELLDEELSRARIVPDEELPADVVSIYSQIEFEDIDSGKASVATLVYPEEADLAQNKVSILAPVGAALIGLRVGQTIEWPLPSGKMKRIRVKAVHPGENP